jgi:hypothetical protein
MCCNMCLHLLCLGACVLWRWGLAGLWLIHVTDCLLLLLLALLSMMAVMMMMMMIDMLMACCIDWVSGGWQCLAMHLSDRHVAGGIVA